MDDKEWSVPMTLKIRTTVVVRASSADAARDMASAGEWDSDERACGDVSDWEVTGHPTAAG